VIDDDPDLVRPLCRALEDEGYHTISEHDGQAGLKAVYEHRPDLVVLDIMFPTGMDGWTVCRRIREISEIPIIMLTAKSGHQQIIQGLNIGADDYVVKPFQTGELIARIRALLRRTNTSSVDDNIVYDDGYLSVNIAERKVAIKDEPVVLTPLQFKLLAELLKIYPRVGEYRFLLERIWGWEYIDDIDYLRVYIWHLRKKLEPNPKEPIYFVNELQIGYRFVSQMTSREVSEMGS
jgi:two-component system KDP operon response regulator KdpE